MHYRLWMCDSSDFAMAAKRFDTEAGTKALCYLWTKECILVHPHQAYYDQALQEVTNAFSVN